MRLPSFLKRDSTLENPSVDLIQAILGQVEMGTASGIAVSVERALRMIAVYAAVRVISESIASLPFPVYRQEGRSRIRVPTDPRWPVLNDSPNPEMYAMELHETVLGHANLRGRGYEYVVRDAAGEVAELWPLLPQRTERVRDRAGKLYYRVELESGERRILSADEVVEVKAFMGFSPVQDVAREAIGTALAAEEYGSRFWQNDARPGGLIEIPEPMEDDEFDQFRRRWNAGHQGLKRSHLLGILTSGASWKEVGIAPQDAQYIDSRKWGVLEVCRCWRVPPYKLAHLEAGTVSYASVETQQIDFVVDSLRPWTVRVEQATKMRLFSSSRDREQDLYPQFNIDALLRGDTLSRYRSHQIGILTGWMSRSEARELEDLPHVEGLDAFLIPVNTQEIGTPQAEAARQISPQAWLEQLAADARMLGLPQNLVSPIEDLIGNGNTPAITRKG